MDLAELRATIDAIDAKIITLLSKRAKLVSAAGKLKKNEQGVRDPKRVELVIEKVRAQAGTAESRASKQVNHPGLPGSRNHAPAKFQMTGFGLMLSFESVGIEQKDDLIEDLERAMTA